MTDEIEASHVSDYAFPADGTAPELANGPPIGLVAVKNAATVSTGSEWMASSGPGDWYYQKGARRTRRSSVVWSRRPTQHQAVQAVV